MARYDAFAGHLEDGYLLDVQTELLDHLRTRVVVPLLPLAETPAPIRKLNPVFEMGGRKLVMATQFIATLPVARLGESRFSLAAHQEQIEGALEMLFQGF